MANHLSSFKRIRQNQIRRIRNKYAYKSTKTAIKKFLINKEGYSKVISMIDKLVKRNIIHKNKSSRLKNSLRKNISNK
ncbi:30S ribosomal protein S20 [Blattabacterium cuenoti]|uniref:30S ribosomal protein S20 n=1 Tax=Blattabacterium cuenoti TaxID=1653831 RepID=UPI00163BB0C2|nr:30S ribosomal protein S20 [Blattabacterium cuenoti]